MSHAPTVTPGVLPTVSPVRADYVDIVEELFQRASTPLFDLGALASDSSCGQIYHPLNGAKKSSGSIQTARLPMAGAPGGAVNAVAAFQEYTPLNDYTLTSETVSLTSTGTYTFSVVSGSGTIAANTASGTGWGTATPGSPVTVDITGTGTVDVTASAGARSTLAKSDYDLPFTGLAAGSTRDGSLCVVDLTGMGYDDDGCIIGFGIPYGWSIDERPGADRPGIFGVPSTSTDVWIACHDTGVDQYDVMREYDSVTVKLTHNGVLPTRNRMDVVAVDWCSSAIAMYVNGELVGSTAVSGGSYTALGETRLGRRIGDLDKEVFNGVTGALLGPPLTATEHAAIAACLGAGRYFPPRS